MFKTCTCIFLPAAGVPARQVSSKHLQQEVLSRMMANPYDSCSETGMGE